MAGTRTPVREWRPPGDAPVDAHPRIRARRAEVARGVGRRRLRRLRAVLAVVCVVVWALVGLRSPLLDVDRVTVVGAERVGADEIRRAAPGITDGTPLVEVDLARARAGVAALPWIDEVRVTRLWPGTIRVVVSERHEVAAVETVTPEVEGWALLDADGRVLDVVAAEPGLPLLPGERAAAPGRTLGGDDRRALAVLGALPSDLRSVTTTTAQGPDGLELVLDDGFRVVLGDGAELGAKAEAAEAVRQHAEAPGERGCRIDVRVPSAPVLTRGRGCA